MVWCGAEDFRHDGTGVEGQADDGETGRRPLAGEVDQQAELRRQELDGLARTGPEVSLRPGRGSRPDRAVVVAGEFGQADEDVKDDQIRGQRPHQLDVAGAEAVTEPVVGRAPEGEDKAHARGDEAGREAHAQGVEQAAVRAILLVGRLPEVVPGVRLPERFPVAVPGRRGHDEDHDQRQDDPAEDVENQVRRDPKAAPPGRRQDEGRVGAAGRVGDRADFGVVGQRHRWPEAKGMPAKHAKGRPGKKETLFCLFLFPRLSACFAGNKTMVQTRAPRRRRRRARRGLNFRSSPLTKKPRGRVSAR